MKNNLVKGIKSNGKFILQYAIVLVIVFFFFVGLEIINRGVSSLWDEFIVKEKTESTINKFESTYSEFIEYNGFNLDAYNSFVKMLAFDNNIPYNVADIISGKISNILYKVETEKVDPYKGGRELEAQLDSLSIKYNIAKTNIDQFCSTLINYIIED